MSAPHNPDPRWQQHPYEQSAGGPAPWPQQPPAGYGNYPPQGPPPEPPKPKRKVWHYVVGGLGGLFLIGQMLGGGDESVATSTPVDAAPVAADSMAAAAEVPAVVEPAAEPEVEGIGNGTHLVGPDIAPGTYRSAGAQEGFFELCIWSTRDGASTNSDMIDFGTANADDQQVVEISESVGAFETSNCEPWTLVE